MRRDGRGDPLELYDIAVIRSEAGVWHPIKVIARPLECPASLFRVMGGEGCGKLPLDARQ